MLEHLRWCGLLKRSWPQALLARTCLARDSGAWPLAALVGIKGDGQGRLERLGQMASGWVSRPANTMTTCHRDTTMVHADEMVSKQLIRGSSIIDALSFHESRALRTRRRFVVRNPRDTPVGALTSSGLHSSSARTWCTAMLRAGTSPEQPRTGVDAK